MKTIQQYCDEIDSIHLSLLWGEDYYPTCEFEADSEASYHHLLALNKLKDAVYHLKIADKKGEWKEV